MQTPRKHNWRYWGSPGYLTGFGYEFPRSSYLTFLKGHGDMIIVTENVMSFPANMSHMVDFNRVSRYSCGPTVYDHAHLGHAW